jgi:hypothetical protein
MKNVQNVQDVQNSIYRMIAKRNEIWQRYDHAMSNQKNLTQRFSKYSKDRGQVMKTSPLTSHQLPLDEIQACINEIEKKEGQIKKEKNTIEAYQRELDSLSLKANFLFFFLIIGGFVMVIFLYGKFSNQSNSSELYQLKAQKVVLKLSK